MRMETDLTGRRNHWRSVAVAVAWGLAAIGVVVVLTLALAFQRDTVTRFVTPEAAAAEFARVRARFGAARPMIELYGRNGASVIRRRTAAPRHPLSELHVLAYNPRSRKLVRADIPAWLLRAVSLGGWIRLAAVDASNAAGRITLEDLERHGPGLLLSLQASDRRQVLVWAQ